MNLIARRSVAAVALALAASSSWAGLLGQQVTGYIGFFIGSPNFFDPANALVPAGFLNVAGSTVTISTPAQEFGIRDRANFDIADFTDTQLFVSDEVFSTASSWTMTFTSVTPGLFTGLSLVSQTFAPGLTYSLAGDTITIAWAGTFTPGLRSATFDVGTSATTVVPVPGSLPLLIGGIAMFAALRRAGRAS